MQSEYEKNLKKRLYIWLRVKGLKYIINNYYHNYAGKKYDPIIQLDKELSKCGKYYKNWAYYFKNWPDNEPEQVASENNIFNDHIEIELRFRDTFSKETWENVFKYEFINNMIDLILENNTSDYIDLFRQFTKEWNYYDII